MVVGQGNAHFCFRSCRGDESGTGGQKALGLARASSRATLRGRARVPLFSFAQSSCPPLSARSVHRWLAARAVCTKGLSQHVDVPRPASNTREADMSSELRAHRFGLERAPPRSGTTASAARPRQAAERRVKTRRQTLSLRSLTRTSPAAPPRPGSSLARTHTRAPDTKAKGDPNHSRGARSCMHRPSNSSSSSSSSYTPKTRTHARPAQTHSTGGSEAWRGGGIYAAWRRCSAVEGGGDGSVAGPGEPRERRDAPMTPVSSSTLRLARRRVPSCAAREHAGEYACRESERVRAWSPSSARPAALEPPAPHGLVPLPDLLPPPLHRANGSLQHSRRCANVRAS